MVPLRLKAPLLACAAAATLVSASGTARAQNLLVNGGFENLKATWAGDPTGSGFMTVDPYLPGVIPGWEVTSSRPLAWVRDGNRYGMTASEGDFHIDLSGPYDGPTFDELSTAFPAVVGGRYRLSFDMGVRNGPCYDLNCSGPIGIWVTVVTYFNIPYFSDYNPAGPGQHWTRVSVDFTAGDALQVLRFTGVQGQQYIGIDNVVVEALAVPEPATWTLWLGALGAAALRRRQNRRVSIAAPRRPCSLRPSTSATSPTPSSWHWRRSSC